MLIRGITITLTGDWHSGRLAALSPSAWPRVKFDIFPSCECEDSPKLCPVLKHNCNVMFMALFYCDAIFSNCHALCTHNFIGICLLIIYYNNNNFCNYPQSDFYPNAVNAPHTWHIHGVLRHLAKDIDNCNGIKTDESRLLMFVLVILWLDDCKWHSLPQSQGRWLYIIHIPLTSKFVICIDHEIVLNQLWIFIFYLMKKSINYDKNLDSVYEVDYFSLQL